MSLPIDPAPLNLELLRIGAALLQCVYNNADKLPAAVLQFLGAATLFYRGSKILTGTWANPDRPDGKVLRFLAGLALNLTKK